MVIRRARGAALVEYAFILVCVTGLAGAGLKSIHRKASKSADTAVTELAMSGAGASGTGPSMERSPSTGSSRSTAFAPAKPRSPPAPKKIERKSEDPDDV